MTRMILKIGVLNMLFFLLLPPVLAMPPATCDEPCFISVSDSEDQGYAFRKERAALRKRFNPDKNFGKKEGLQETEDYVRTAIKLYEKYPQAGAHQRSELATEIALGALIVGNHYRYTEKALKKAIEKYQLLVDFGRRNNSIYGIYAIAAIADVWQLGLQKDKQAVKWYRRGIKAIDDYRRAIDYRRIDDKGEAELRLLAWGRIWFEYEIEFLETGTRGPLMLSTDHLKGFQDASTLSIFLALPSTQQLKNVFQGGQLAMPEAATRFKIAGIVKELRGKSDQEILDTLARNDPSGFWMASLFSGPEEAFLTRRDIQPGQKRGHLSYLTGARKLFLASLPAVKTDFSDRPRESPQQVFALYRGSLIKGDIPTVLSCYVPHLRKQVRKSLQEAPSERLRQRGEALSIGKLVAAYGPYLEYEIIIADWDETITRKFIHTEEGWRFSD